MLKSIYKLEIVQEEFGPKTKLVDTNDIKITPCLRIPLKSHHV